MIFKGLKEKSIKKAIRKTLSNKSVVATNATNTRSLAIVINYEKLVDYKPLLDIAKAINISASDVYIIGYVNKIYKNGSYLIPVFTDSSFGMKGKVKNEEVAEFLKRDYDIVINYYTEPNIYLELVSTLCKSEFKVGLTTEGEANNNLVLKTDEKDFSQFKNELVKYLSILKKI
ncbi:DUF6913 domain-containing protein [Joostella sp. CR20]|uniref:DUF6913 domain-containing protein n=1 Tax=Joostella sp. CR20 TaxID=2804312 RepID=UPI00313D1C22